MWMRIITSSFDPAREAEILKLVEETYWPALKAVPGFTSYVAGSKDGRTTAVLMFDTEDAPGRVDPSVRAAVEAAGVTVHSIEEYEITRRLTP